MGHHPVLHHLHIYCSDLIKMQNFILRTCGGTVLGPQKYGSDNGMQLLLSSGLRISLQEKSCAAADTVQYASGINHFGIEVPDLDASLAHALADPTIVLDKDIFELGEYRCAFVRGPENLRLELLQKLS